MRNIQRKSRLLHSRNSAKKFGTHIEESLLDGCCSIHVKMCVLFRYYQFRLQGTDQRYRPQAAAPLSTREKTETGRI